MKKNQALLLYFILFLLYLSLLPIYLYLDPSSQSIIGGLLVLVLIIYYLSIFYIDKAFKDLYNRWSKLGFFLLALGIFLGTFVLVVFVATYLINNGTVANPDLFVLLWKSMSLILIMPVYSHFSIQQTNLLATWLEDKSYIYCSSVWIGLYILSFVSLASLGRTDNFFGLAFIALILWAINLSIGSYTMASYLMKKNRHRRSIVSTIGILMTLIPIFYLFFTNAHALILLCSVCGINIFISFFFGKEIFALKEKS